NGRGNAPNRDSIGQERLARSRVKPYVGLLVSQHEAPSSNLMISLWHDAGGGAQHRIIDLAKIPVVISVQMLWKREWKTEGRRFDRSVLAWIFRANLLPARGAAID